MKTKIYTILFFCLATTSAITLSCCKNSDDSHCPSTNEKVNLTRKDSFMPYLGNEHLKFLHNNTDTQIFIAQGKETYYTTEGISQQGECSKDYESVRVKFINQTSNDILLIDYCRDRNNFANNLTSNPYTFYKVSFKGKNFLNELLYTSSSFITINGVSYDYVFLVGTDTSSNYSALRLTSGLLKIRVNNENWDLIP